MTRIAINRTYVHVDVATVNGRDIRQMGDIPEDYDVWEIIPGHHDEKVGDDQEVRINQGSRFFSCPRVINGSDHKPPNPERTTPMTLFNTQDPAIADAFMLVCDALTEIEDRNLYERQGTAALDDEQTVLTMAVRDRTEAVKRAAIEGPVGDALPQPETVRPALKAVG